MLDPRGYFLYLYTGVCAWRVKFKPKNMDSSENFAPKKNRDLAYFLLKNIGENCVLVINLMARDYF